MLKQVIWLYQVIHQINPPQSETSNTSTVLLCEATVHLTTTVSVGVPGIKIYILVYLYRYIQKLILSEERVK